MNKNELKKEAVKRNISVQKNDGQWTGYYSDGEFMHERPLNAGTEKEALQEMIKWWDWKKEQFSWDTGEI